MPAGPDISDIEFAEIPLGDLSFDPMNPRLPEHLDPTDTAAVLEFMLDDAGLLDLMGSIAKQGFFPGEPLLIASVAGRLTVVEGNRRFASCLLLVHPDLAPTRRRPVLELAASVQDPAALSEIPCLVFPNRDSILDHLGYRHVTGIKEWEPLAKARFLEQRFQAETGSDIDRFRSLAKSIGSRSDYVGRLLTALTLFRRMQEQRFYDLPGLTASSIDFSLISSLLAYTAIVTYLGLASSQDVRAENLEDDHLAHLTRIVFDRNEGRTVLGESRNIRKLADALGDERAGHALENGSSLAVAVRLTEAGDDTFRSLVASARESLSLAQDELPNAAIGASDVESLTEVQALAESLLGSAQRAVE